MYNINDLEIRSPRNGIQQTRLFSNRQEHIHPPSTQVLPFHGRPSFVGHYQDLRQQLLPSSLAAWHGHSSLARHDHYSDSIRQISG